MKIEQIGDSVLDEKMYFGKHDSGLPVYVIPKRGFNKKYAVFATHYGSIDNKFKVPNDKDYTKVPDGIAHFLEHKLFEQKDANIFQKFSQLGASPNAYTNYNTTTYLFSCTENFNDNFKLLLDFVQNPYLTDENVEKEKGIIAQEIKMYEDNPQSKVLTNLLKCLYVNNPINIDVAGTLQSINSIDKDILYKCYNTFYHPSNMVVFVVGDVNEKEIFNLVELKVDKSHRYKIQRGQIHEPQKINTKYMEKNLPISIPQFRMGFKNVNVGLQGKELLKKIILSNIILDMIFGRSSDFYNSLYTEGLINETFSVEFIGEKRYCFSILGGESKHPELVKEKILYEIEKHFAKGLNKDYFERIKRKKIGRFIRKFNQIENIAYSFVNYIFNDIVIFDYLDELNGLTFEDVCNEFVQMFDFDKTAISIINPI